MILDNHSAHISKETKAWIARQPAHRFAFTFTPKHGSWLNLIEGFFSKLARSVLNLRKPTIDTACVHAGLGIPSVDVEHETLGQMAAEHFLVRGYRHFRYFGSGRAYYARLRLASS